MGWTAPMTFTVGGLLTAAQLNSYVRDNTLYFKGASGASIATVEGTSSSTYTDLATVGPAISVTTDVQALVAVYAGMSAAGGVMGFAVSGATTIAASDNYALYINAVANLGVTILITGLTPGVNTFTAKYRAVSGLVNFSNRRISADPA